MSWSRIKTILIILFLFTDLFLAASIFVAEKKETEVSQDVFDSAIYILSEHNITLSDSVTLPKISSATVLQADNAVTDYDSFAKMLLGENYDENYVSEKGKIAFSGDKFSFVAKDIPSEIGAITEKAAQKKLFTFLKSIGFNMSGAKVVSAKEEDGIWRFTVRGYAEKLPVFSCELGAELSKNGIISLSGSWFNIRDTREQSGGIKSTLGLLIDFAEEFDRPCKITEIDFGYSVFDNDNYHKSASLIPVNKLVLNDNTEYYLDARANEQ
ncbi:MAG: hypothetical protein IKR46_03180 [Clostridia bacterium]|nr:hypothetical protein [Clostridia bacterium]